ncbi:hypothetical protein LTR95_016733 [Oleoguttula sp. CCFEE 5521]
MAASNLNSQITLPCPFTDTVPTEIRKEIFGYLLTKGSPIQFRYIVPPGPDGRRERKWIAVPDIKWNSQTRRNEATHYDIARLLGTCKLFRTEASEVLFSRNVFSFPTTSSVIKFLETIGGPKYAIRAIAVDEYIQSTSKQFWQSLLPLKSGHNVKPIKRDLLQKHMGPLLTMLRAAYDQRQQSIDLQDLVQVKDPEYWLCRGCATKHPEFRDVWSMSIAQCKELRVPEYDELKESIRALIAAALQ